MFVLPETGAAGIPLDLEQAGGLFDQLKIIICY
jgi:hypothetical protein